MKIDRIRCPVCGNKTLAGIRANTVLKNYPILLLEMQTGNADRSGELESNRYKEAGTLIFICTPPCMGKTIAAVFLRLSGVSVREFYR